MRLSAKRHLFAPTVALSALVSFAATSAQAQVPTHIYELNGSLNDELGGPALTNNGAALGPTGLTFGANQGPSLTGGVDASDYSIEMYFSLNDVTGGYRKIIDFRNLTEDEGLYNDTTRLDFYSVIEGGPGAFSNGALAHVVLSRVGATNQVTGYVNGVQEITFTDTGGLGIFTILGGSSVAHFLQDDDDTNGEATGGFLDFIRIYDNPLGQAEVTARYNATVGGAAAAPEPGTLALLGAGALLAGAGAIRRRPRKGR